VTFRVAGSGPSTAQSTPAASTSASVDTDVEPDDDIEPGSSQVPTATASTSNMASSYERMQAIIANEKIGLDAKLAIFTVVGTNQPHMVRLFPSSSCSCPAQSECYHMLAARNEPHKHTVNLTQLRRNVWKCIDKTYGRKRPRLQDIDVVPAGDADEATASATLAAITPSSPTSLPGFSAKPVRIGFIKSVWAYSAQKS